MNNGTNIQPPNAAMDLDANLKSGHFTTLSNANELTFRFNVQPTKARQNQRSFDSF